ncbi:GntR family transcriptional regulator [Gordonia insulae]|uniref:Putative D-xylose utilization operon transcriptional repressor n=1 Tax=Gordonia insulae TaxID=2420509 RepID=A0A3G8JKL6_9ACTN|nr:GntR family transcriptional regulator [Gordonia insulae]AZG45165.1 putative D-xylose utilization operon transcriptional repressor [Gordonia insulae]
MSRTALRRTQLTDDVAEHLRHRIMTGDLRPGEFIRLDETATTLGCSVTPVREALVALRGEGLVRSSPHRGYVVETLNRGDIEDIFWMQAELSARLASHAAGSPALDTHLATMRDTVDSLADAVEAGDHAKVLAAEFAFHRQVNLTADSKKLAWFVYSAGKYTPYSLYARDREWGRQAVDSHRRLIGHLSSGDSASIRAEIHARFADARDRLIRQLDSIGFWDQTEPGSASSATSEPATETA